MPRKGPAPSARWSPTRCTTRRWSPSWSTRSCSTASVGRRAHRLRRPRGLPREERHRPGRHPQARDGQRQADPRGPQPPCRWRDLPGAGRGPAPRQPPSVCAGWSVLQPAREKTMIERLRTSCSTPATASVLRQAARGHPQDGGVQQGLRALPLVSSVARSAQQPAGQSKTKRGTATVADTADGSPRYATSASWRTSTLVRPRRPSGSCSTPASRTRSVRSTRALPSWTGWSRSRNAASRSPPPPRSASGRATRSRSSTRPATSTSRSRSSGRCACSTVRSRSTTVSPVSSRRPRTSGARRTSTTSRGCASSTSSTAPAPTSSAACR